MSERAERELKEWKEIYEIPYHMEFQVKTLLGLQEEYDNIKPAENNTKTRETLLKMINDVLRGLNLKLKNKSNIIIDTEDMVTELIVRGRVLGEEHVVRVTNYSYFTDNGYSMDYIKNRKDKFTKEKFIEISTDFTNKKDLVKMAEGMLAKIARPKITINS